jgi:hypothetical protein
MRLDDYVVERLAPKRKQYTVWDLAVQGCGVRVSRATKACVISVWTGGRLKFETVGVFPRIARTSICASRPSRESAS